MRRASGGVARGGAFCFLVLKRRRPLSVSVRFRLRPVRGGLRPLRPLRPAAARSAFLSFCASGSSTAATGGPPRTPRAPIAGDTRRRAAVPSQRRELHEKRRDDDAPVDRFIISFVRFRTRSENEGVGSSARPAPGPPRTPARWRAATHGAQAGLVQRERVHHHQPEQRERGVASPSRLAQTHAVAPAIAGARRARGTSDRGDVAETNNACAASAADASPDAFDEDAVPSEEVPEEEGRVAGARRVARERERRASSESALALGVTGRSQGARPASSRRRRPPAPPHRARRI